MVVRVPSVLVISVIAHATLFAALARITLRRHIVSVAPTEDEAEPAAAQPIEVVFLDGAQELATASASGRSDNAPWSNAANPRQIENKPESTAANARHLENTHAVSPQQISAAGDQANRSASEAAAGSIPGPAADDMPGDNGAGSATDTHVGTTTLQLDPQTAERIASAPRARGAEPTITGRLESTPGGGAVVNDAVTTMTVERDGNVKLDDKPDIDIKLKLPIPHLDIEGMRRDAGKVLTDWYRDPYANTKFGRKADLSRVIMAVPGACDHWGDTWCDDPSAPAQEKYFREQKKTRGSLAGGNADISAWLYRKYAGDPYASRKLKLLDDTRDERVARGSAFRGEQLARSAELMQRTLEDLWRATSDPVVRKEALFELWDDCAEGEGPRAEAGARARAMVIGWIRAKLPEGSAGAFSVEEIARFDARRASKQRFTPY